MKKFLAIVALSGFMVLSVTIGYADSGEELFKKRCSMCHPNGGNIIKPEMTLHKKHLAIHGIKTADDIIRIMRNPGPGMPKFSEDILSNEDAKGIAEYILKTFNSHTGLQEQAGVYANYVGRLGEATTKVDSFMLRKE
jgi:mono/diheme cytochrome c family protein